jgi:hypothetical protein
MESSIIIGKEIAVLLFIQINDIKNNITLHLLTPGTIVAQLFLSVFYSL